MTSDWRARTQAGFSLPEVLVSLALLTIIVSGITSGLQFAAEEMVKALNIRHVGIALLDQSKTLLAERRPFAGRGRVCPGRADPVGDALRHH